MTRGQGPLIQPTNETLFLKYDYRKIENDKKNDNSVSHALCGQWSGVDSAGTGCGNGVSRVKSYPGSDLPVATAKDDAVLRHVPDLEKTAHGYKNVCGNRNRIGVLHLDLGGVLQGATVTYDPDSCWGQTGVNSQFLIVTIGLSGIMVLSI